MGAPLADVEHDHDHDHSPAAESAAAVAQIPAVTAVASGGD
jgi:hypothetical protein